MEVFELGKEIEKDAFRLVTSVRQRKNSPARNRTSDLRIPHSDALPLSLRSGVLFLKGTQNFLSHAREKMKKHLSQYSLLFHGHLFSREPLKKSRMCRLVLNADLFRFILLCD